MYKIKDINKILQKDTIFLRKNRYAIYKGNIRSSHTNKNKPKFNKDLYLQEILESRISLGLCCINTILRDGKKNGVKVDGIKKDVFTSRKMIRANFTVEKAKKLAIENLRDLYYMIKWNDIYGISVFRLSSEIFPRFTDNECEKYTIDFARKYLTNIGKAIKRTNQRVLMHPGQYNQVGAINDTVFQSTVYDLKHHADILDAMDIGDEGILIVHGGGTYGDKNATKQRWIENFGKLPENVKKRLALENCEKSYSPRDCLDICKKVGIPMIFDTFHYDCYRKLHPDEELETPENLLPEIIATWKYRKWIINLPEGIKVDGNSPYESDDENIIIKRCPPIFHVSEQGSGRVGHHSDYVKEIPKYLLDIPKLYNIDIHIEIEAKMKEQAIYYLYEKYSK